MKRIFCFSMLVPMLMLWTPFAPAQTEDTGAATPASTATSPLGQEGGKNPVEITSDGETRYEGGMAISENNVVIYSGDSTMYSDYSQYNPTTHDVLLKGHVKIYQPTLVFSGESALYNLDTKNVRASDFLGDSLPYRFQGDNLYSLPGGGYGVKNGFFTTNDSSNPDYRLRARTVRIYPDDRIIFSNVTLFVGKTPIFWWPYLYQSLNEANSFLITPGYTSTLGAYLLTDFTFPIVSGVTGEFHLNLYSARGIGTGLDLNYTSGDEKKKAQTPSSNNWEHAQSWSKIKSFAITDNSTDINNTSLSRQTVSAERYRLSWQSKLYITDDWSATIDVTKLSDSLFLQDFYPAENRIDPQPDAVAAVTRSSENWTLTGLARGQVNEFQQTTERLPEVDLDVKRTPLFNTGIFYEGESSVGKIGVNFPTGSTTPDYSTLRADTFHQLTYPKTLFGWLSVVPRAGFRATYYEQTGSLGFRLPDNVQAVINSNEAFVTSQQTQLAANQQTIGNDQAQLAGATPQEAVVLQSQIAGLQEQNAAIQTNITNVQNADTTYAAFPKTVPVLNEGDAAWRTVFNLGIEASFKISKTYDQVEWRAIGLDQLRHVIQPYLNFSYVAEPSLKPSQILPIDTYIPSTQLAPIDFPELVALDSIDQATVLRLGVRNKLLTKRDDQSFVWMSLDTFFDVNYQNPYDSSNYSNLFNRFYFAPVPWANLTLDTQMPVFDKGFTEINSSLNFMASRDLNFSIGHRYLQNNPNFTDSSLLFFNTYYQINENWAVSLQEQYEFQTSILQSQRYTLYRDLTSWVGSLSAIITDNGGGKTAFGLYVNFTLKDLPSLNLNLNVDPSSTTQY